MPSALPDPEPTNQCVRQGRSVRISDAPPEINFFDRATEEEALQAWYLRRDYADFSNDCRYIIYAVQDKVLGFSNECTRGLEKFIYSRESRQLNQKMAVEVVLREQERQRALGVNDQNLIKEISTIVTSEAQSLARDMATVDEIYAATCDDEAVPASYVSTKCNSHHAESWWYKSWHPLSSRVCISSSWLYQ